MELKQLTKSDFPQAEALWQRAFFDSDAFIEAYFGAEENVGNAFAYVERDKILSQLFVLPFKASVMHTKCDVAFLSGCATAPEERNRDLMRNLIRAVFEKMLDEGIAVSFLHPFLHEFYRKFGYETVAYVNRYETEGKQGKPCASVRIAEKLEEIPLAAFEDAYAKYVREFGNYFIRSSERFYTWLKMNFADGGKAIYTQVDGELAYAFYEDKKGVAEIFEIVYFSERALRTLIEALGCTSFFLPVSRVSPNFKPVKREQFTMMRVLDPVKMLKSKRFRVTTKFTIHIDDNFLGKTYDLSVDASPQKTVVKKIDRATDYVVDIARFAELIACGDYVSAGPGEEGIFTPGTSCFFETF